MYDNETWVCRDNERATELEGGLEGGCGAALMMIMRSDASRGDGCLFTRAIR